MTKKNETHIWVKQTRGMAGKSENQRLCLKGLGLGRIGKERLLNDTPAIRGLVEKVYHLINIEVRKGKKA
jgi:large subunit ribosomal protein L30